MIHGTQVVDNELGSLCLAWSTLPTVETFTFIQMYNIRICILLYIYVMDNVQSAGHYICILLCMCTYMCMYMHMFVYVCECINVNMNHTHNPPHLMIMQFSWVVFWDWQKAASAMAYIWLQGQWKSVFHYHCYLLVKEKHYLPTANMSKNISIAKQCLSPHSESTHGGLLCFSLPWYCCLRSSV